MASGGLQQPLVGGTRSGRKICVAWLCTALWIAVIHALAGDQFSADDSSRIIGPLLRWLLRDASPEWIAATHVAVRRAAHVVEYAILALLALRALRLSFDRSTAWLAAATLAVVMVVAATDESRQAASAKRTGALSDVTLDISGGVAALVLARAVQRSRGLST